GFSGARPLQIHDMNPFGTFCEPASRQLQRIAVIGYPGIVPLIQPHTAPAQNVYGWNHLKSVHCVATFSTLAKAAAVLVIAVITRLRRGSPPRRAPGLTIRRLVTLSTCS